MRVKKVTCADCGTEQEVSTKATTWERCKPCAKKHTLAKIKANRKAGIRHSGKGRPPKDYKPRKKWCTACGKNRVAPDNQFLCVECHEDPPDEDFIYLPKSNLALEKDEIDFINRFHNTVMANVGRPDFVRWWESLPGGDV